MSIKAFDAVDTNFFENYFYLDGISEKFGYKKFEVIHLEENRYTLQESISQEIDYTTTVLKIISYSTILLPLIALIGKILFRLQNEFAVVTLNLDDPIKVGSYNILFPQSLPVSKYSTPVGYSSSDGTGQNLYENSQFRWPIIQKNLINADLDIVCLQEVTKPAEEFLKASDLGNTYYSIYAQHPHGSTHGVAILYKKNRFKLKTNPTFHNALDKRAHVVADFHDGTTQKVVRVASCHLLDPRDPKNTRGEHTTALINSVTKAPDADYTIIAGDMNQDETGFGLVPCPAFTPLIEESYQCDANRDSSEYTKENYGNGPLISKNRRIDWIWAKGATPEHLPLPEFDNRGSDHRLVAAFI